MSTTQLSNSRELVERSLFHSIRKEIVDKGYLPDINAKTENTIVGLSTILPYSFSVVGNLTSLYLPGRKFEVLASTGNNSTYTIISSTFSTPNTIIVVAEPIPSAVVDGKLSIYTYYDDPNGVLTYRAAFNAVVAAKTFAIEVFGPSNSQAKYLKKVPRIVIITNQSLPGSLGGAPDRVYTPANPDPLNPGSYTASILPPQTVDITFEIHLVSNSSVQSRVLHGIVGLSVPKRGYIKFYDDDTKMIFTSNYGYRSMPNTTEGINEDIYLYKAEDIFEIENAPIAGTIAPISQITVNTNVGTPNNPTPFNNQVIT